MPVMITRNIHTALRNSQMLGPTGQETVQLKRVLETEGFRLGQLHNMWWTKTGSKARPFPHMILLLEEVTGSVREFFHVVIDLDYKILEKKHPHKDRGAENLSKVGQMGKKAGRNATGHYLSPS